MFIYYKQKEKDDLAKVEAVNEILKELFFGFPKVYGVTLSREEWLEILSGTTTLKNVVINAYMNQHYTQEELKSFNVYNLLCPDTALYVWEQYTEQLGDIRFRPGVIDFAPNGLPQVSAAKIKELYPRWYFVEVEDIDREQVRENMEIASKYATNENFRYACKNIFNADTFIPRPGFRWTTVAEDGKRWHAKVTFTETDYYQDMAKRKLHL